MKAVISIAPAALILAGCDKIPALPGVTAPQTAAAAVAGAPPAGALPMCVEPIVGEIAFTAPDAKDIYRVAAIGADCKDATVLTTVHTAGGALVWAHADLAADTMAFAGIEGTSETHAAALKKLMDAWVDTAEAGPAADAPEWKEGAERPEGPSGLYYGVSLTREEYNNIRTLNGRMLCHPISLNRTLCVVYNPNGAIGGTATEFFDMRS